MSLCVLTVCGWVLWSQAVYEPVCSHSVQGGYCGLGLCISLCVLTVYGWVLWSRAVYEPVCSHCVRVGTVVSGCV